MESADANRSPLLEARRWVRLTYGWVRYPARDHLVLVPLIAWGILGFFDVVPLFFESLSTGTRKTIFQTLASVSATTAGLTLTSVSIMINLVKTPLSTLDRLLPNEDKSRVGSVFIAALPKLAATFVIAMVSLTHQGVRGAGSNWILEILLLWSSTAALLALCRIVWVLKRLLNLSNA